MSMVMMVILLEVLAAVRTNSAFRLCRAVAAIPMAISAMSATTATGGVPRRKTIPTPTAGTCSSAARMWAIFPSTFLQFVASRTEKNLHRSGAYLVLGNSIENYDLSPIR